MLRSSFTSAVLLALLTTICVPAQGGWYEFWHRVHLDFHRNNAWPEPFHTVDRKAYFVPLEAQTAKGWLRQNTIGHHHFDPTTQQLTEAGRLKLRWILTQAPTNHRSVVVLRGYSDEITSIRLDSVQQTATQILPSGNLPQIHLTDIEARGWSAADIDAIGQKAKDSMPAPILPSNTAAGS